MERPIFPYSLSLCLSLSLSLSLSLFCTYKHVLPVCRVAIAEQVRPQRDVFLGRLSPGKDVDL